MVKPASLWALCKSADVSTLGRVCAALGRQPIELNAAEKALVSVIEQDSTWLDEAIEERRSKDRERARKSRHAESEMSHGKSVTTRIPKCHTEKTESAESEKSEPSFRSSVLPSFLPKENRSVTVRAAKNGNGNGTELINKVRAFKVAAAEDEGAFFAPEFDPVIIAAAVTGDGHSSRAFRKELERIGEDAFRTELFAFHRETQAGEVADNAGAALYARLKSKPNKGN